MKRTALPTTLVCLLFVLALAGCETTTRQTSAGAPPAGTAITPRVAVEAPADLHEISGYLLRYRVLHEDLPESLGELRTAGIMPAEGFDGLDNYAYRPSGLGTLSDGRTIMVVDTAIRVEGHVWCILAAPSRNPRIASMAVSLVSMSELQAAAQRSR